MSDKTVRIRRADHNTENRYFMMLRATAQHRALSYEARGVLAYLLSKPNDWEVKVKDLQQEGCGRDKVYRILRELETFRYLTRELIRVNGTVKGIEYVVYESPFPEKPDTAQPDTANTEHTNNRSKQSTEKRVNRSLTTSAKRTTKKAAPAPTGVDKKDYEDVPYGERYAIIHAWESYAPGKHIAPYKTPENQALAAELFRSGVTEQNVIDFIQEQIKDTYWQGKTITLQTIKKMIPGWLAHHQAKASKVVGTIAPRFEDTPPADPMEWAR